MLSLLRLEGKPKNYSNPFGTCIFLFLSYSFGIKTINTFIHSRGSPENHTRFQTKLGKVYTRVPVFRPKRRKNPTRWGGTYLYSLYKGVPPGASFSFLPPTKFPNSFPFTPYLSNIPTNLYMRLLNLSLFCFVLYCYAFVQYCNVKTIQYNAMHKFVGVLDNPPLRRLLIMYHHRAKFRSIVFLFLLWFVCFLN